jgi:uncharacterized membrane protein
MSALLLTSAMKHFREPRFFAQVVPDYICRDAPGPAVAATDAEPGRERCSAVKARCSAVKAKHDGAGRPLAVMTREEWVAVSGLLEAGAAVVLLIPATRRVAAAAVTAMFTAFLAGHVDALRHAYGPAGSAAQRKAHTVRLPLQLPLIVWAWSLRAAKARPQL